MEQPQQGGRPCGHTQHSCRPSPTPPSRRADLQAPQPQLQPMGDSWPPPLGMTKDQERVGQTSSMHPTPHWRHVAEPRPYGLTQSWLHGLGTHLPTSIHCRGAHGAPTPFHVLFQAVPMGSSSSIGTCCQVGLFEISICQGLSGAHGGRGESRRALRGASPQDRGLASL